jgi:hypothetical protein
MDIDWILIMRFIWHKYKIWLLITVFYTAYLLVKSFKILMHFNIHKHNLNLNRSN